MIKLQLCSIGKPHDNVLKTAIEDFTKRINNYYNAEWLIIPSVKNAASLNESELKNKEGKIILNKLNKDDFLVLLDEKGKQLTSVKLAHFIEKETLAGISSIIFLIGGVYGVSEEVQQRADFIWGLSELVFPHMIVRLLLAEQLYRACTILRNEKYHHS